MIGQEHNKIITHPGGGNLELAAAAWLDAKSKRSGSRKTTHAYTDTLLQFRALLQSRGLDLDDDPRAVALVAQAYAGSSTEGKAVAPATFNVRLAVLSSFYSFGIKRGLLEGTNPIALVERRPVQGYAHAAGLDAATIRARLAAIDRRSLLGMRDYSLLSVALVTGRRLAEIAALTIADIEQTPAGVILHWRHTKGGKVMADSLPQPVAAALAAYLQARTRSGRLEQNAPVWVRHDRADPGAQRPLSARGIADICLRRLGTSKVHSLRHTFARSMEQAGAPVSFIQQKLGHSSLQTTTRYLAALQQAENPHAAALVAAFGLE